MTGAARCDVLSNCYVADRWQNPASCKDEEEEAHSSCYAQKSIEQGKC